MTVRRPRRRWVVLALVVLAGLGTIRLLDQPLPLVSYRTADPQTVIAAGWGTTKAWTRLTGVAETETSVTIKVNSLEFLGFLPHTSEADRLEIEVQLKAPLGKRAVIDGSTGLPVPRAD